VGNVATETILSALASRGADCGVNVDALGPSIALTQEIRAKYSQAA
jgi:pyruvate/oxaloacetate carboxyltransferase